MGAAEVMARIYDKDLPKPVLSVLKHWDNIRECRGLLYLYVWVIRDPTDGECFQLLLPSSLKRRVLECVHNSMGHQGIERTMHLLRSRSFWVGMHNDVAQWIEDYQRFVLTKIPQPKIYPLIKSFLASRALKVITVNFIVLEPKVDGHENVLVVTDCNPLMGCRGFLRQCSIFFSHQPKAYHSEATKCAFMSCHYLPARHWNGHLLYGIVTYRFAVNLHTFPIKYKMF